MFPRAALAAAGFIRGLITEFVAEFIGESIDAVRDDFHGTVGRFDLARDLKIFWGMIRAKAARWDTKASRSARLDPQ